LLNYEIVQMLGMLKFKAA